MTKGLGAWLFGYGFALFAFGAAAYLVNPMYPLLLVGGAVAGGLVAAFGILASKGTAWAKTAATMFTLIVMMLGLAMSMQYWLQVSKNTPSVPEAVIATLIFLASAVVLWRLKKKA